MATKKESEDKKAKKPPVKKAAAKTQAAASAPQGQKKGADAVIKAMEKDQVAKATGSKSEEVKAVRKKLSAADMKKADDAIKSKQGVDELKARASEAKQRAQQKILEEGFVSDKPADPLERLANTFDSSARRWEMVVYPSLFAFVLLAGYGFFLIYRLTHDIAILSQSVTHMAVIVSDAMPRMTKDLNTMTGSMDNMTFNIAGMSDDIGGMTGEITLMSGQMNSLTPMSNNIQSLTHNIGSMNRSVYGMQRDMHGMNRTVSSGPFGMMNDIMPFGSNTNVPPPLAPAPTWPSYSGAPTQQPLYNQPQPRVRTVNVVPTATETDTKKNEAPAKPSQVQNGKATQKNTSTPWVK